MQTQKPSQFAPVTITLTSQQEVADVLGALAAYGKGDGSKAKTAIQEAGLTMHYSGNARKTARSLVRNLTSTLGLRTPYFHRT